MQRYESYKPSGIQWVEKIPSHWDVIPLKHVVQLRSGEAITSVDMNDGAYPVYGGNGRRGYFNKYTHDGEFALIGRQGALCGNINYADGKFWASEHAVVVSPKREIATKWLGELLRSMNLNQYSIAAAQPGLSVETISNLKIPVPPLFEQKSIANFLDLKTAEIDAAIAKKERLIELLQEQKNIRIHQAVLRGLNPEAPLCDSGVSWIGEIPAHWEAIPNRYIFREQNARSLRGEETHLSMSQRYGLVPAKELDVQTLQSESYDGAKLCQKGDLVQNRLKAHLAVFAVAPCDGLVSPDYSVFRLQNSENQPGYFERLFKTPNYLGEFSRRVRGIVVGFLRLYSEDFNAIPALVPPCDEQAEIVRFIEKTNKDFEVIRAKIDAEIAMLRELKTISVASAVTGKIKV